MQPTPTLPADGPAPHTPFIPFNQDEKADLAVFLAGAWLKNPQLTFIWMTQADFATTAKDYHQSIITKTDAAAGRAVITLTLQEADERITEGLPYLKAALLTKFKKGKDKAMYAQFGVVSRNGGYDLPHGHTERAKALTTLLAALTTHGLGAGEFGTDYWQPIEAAYTQGTKDAKENASGVSKLVGIKNTLANQVDLVLRKMLTLLEAQYPDEKELVAKRREMGYLKEFN